MERVAEPLRRMGATVLGRRGGRFAPLSISGGDLKGIAYEPPVASAQVKSAVLLAGLYAEGETIVREPVATRDHTERMLLAMGANLLREDGDIKISQSELHALDIQVPGDPSSAAFLLAAAAIVPGSRVVVPNIGVNPGRIGFLRALERMGARIAIRDEETRNGEPVATLELEYGELRGITLGAEDVPAIIDELPVLAVVATQARGVTEVRGAGELRVKETDRIAAIVDELGKMGAKIEARPDGFVIEGPVKLKGAEVNSHGDHRLAMSLAVAGLAAGGQTSVHDTICTDDSFPGFERALDTLRGRGKSG
jgi:3-phosphoshikimate 1-carboxyvinyltransferase